MKYFLKNDQITYRVNCKNFNFVKANCNESNMTIEGFIAMFIKWGEGTVNCEIYPFDLCV